MSYYVISSHRLRGLSDSSKVCGGLKCMGARTNALIPAYTRVVSRGQTLFRTAGKGLGFGHRATCCPAPWSAYQSQHSIQSHDT